MLDIKAEFSPAHLARFGKVGMRIRIAVGERDNKFVKGILMN